MSKDMERLTTRNSVGVAVFKVSYSCDNCNESIWRLPDYGNGSPTDRLADYEDAEEQGLLLRLPYPLGTKHIFFADEKDMEVYKLDAEKIEVHMMPISKKVMYTIDCFEFFIEDFGKIVFLTKEEAEKALKQMGE